MKIKIRYFFEALKFELSKPQWFRNFFITHNSLGLFSINSHINQHTGQPKVAYNTVETAKKCAGKMSEKKGVHFSYYKCLYCGKYHIGRNADNKGENND